MFRNQIEKFFRIKLIHGKKLGPDEISELALKMFNKFGWELTRQELRTMAADENEPLKQLAKKCLNTLWGKFGQKEYSCQEYVNNDVFWQLMQMHNHKEIEVESYEVTRPGEAREES